MNPKGMGLIITSLFILTVPGALYNNLNNSGLVVTQSLSCGGPYLPGQLVDPTCQGNVNAGCQINSNYCTLSGQSVSFLNTNSPFTPLFQGNVFGFFSLITAGGAASAHGPFDVVGNNNYFTANCVVSAALRTAQTAWSFQSCTEADVDGSNMTKANTATFTNVNQIAFAAKTIHFYQFPANNGTWVNACNFQQQINYTTGAGVVLSGYTQYGCYFTNGPYAPSLANWQSKYYFEYIISIPVLSGAAPTGYACTVSANCFHVAVPVQLETWDTASCNNIATQASSRQQRPFLVSPQCDQWIANLKALTNANQGFGLLTPILTFIIGVLMFLGGLGLNFVFQGSVFGTGVEAGGGINRQGTKLMQVVGLGLIVWTVFYSQFATWFTTGILPYGLDGTVGIVSLFLTGIFFFGVYAQSTDS